jgi:hypothetical protein
MKIEALQPEFVEFMPSTLEEGVLYISVHYGTAMHLCCSGCGEKVVTPLTPTDWSLIYDGATVSLTPSIGNWGYACQSHYWIKRNKVIPAPRWSLERVEANRQHDRAVKRRYYDADLGIDNMERSTSAADPEPGRLRRLVRKLKRSV